MKCQHCGNEITDAQARFCPECGQKLVPAAAPQPQRPVQPPVNPNNPAAPQNGAAPAYGAWNQEFQRQPASRPTASQGAPVNRPPQTPEFHRQPQGYQPPQQTYQPPQQPYGGYGQVPQQPQKKSKAWIFIVLAAVLVIFLVVAILIGSAVIRFVRTGALPFQQEETVAEEPFYEDMFAEQTKKSGFLERILGGVKGLLGKEEAVEVPAQGYSDEDYYEFPVEDWEAWEETAPEEEILLMPNCEGMYVDDAMAYLEELGCYVLVEYQYVEDIDADKVYAQSIDYGAQLYGGEEVTLLVSMGPDVCPYDYRQKVEVLASGDSSYATLILSNWENGDWQEQFRCSATVGKNGISPYYGEGKGYSPEGVFKLGIALSANAIGNDTWPFRQVSSSTCVVDDVDSYYYNTLQNKNDLPSGTSYDSVGRKLTNGTNNILIYIEHNGDGLTPDNVVPGKGSVITLCGCSSSIKPTLGCVDISTYDMNTLISLLDYNLNPHIELISQ